MKYRKVALAITLFVPLMVAAQAVEVINKSYQVEASPLPFAPAKKALVGVAPMLASQIEVVTPKAPVSSLFLLRKDQPIHEALQAWAQASGWELLWYPTMSWKTVREADLSGKADVVAAVSEVVNILRDEGKPLRLKISDGNKVLEILSNEVRND